MWKVNLQQSEVCEIIDILDSYLSTLNGSSEDWGKVSLMEVKLRERLRDVQQFEALTLREYMSWKAN